MNPIQAPKPALNVYLDSFGQNTFFTFVLGIVLYSLFRWYIGKNTKKKKFSVTDETKKFTWFVAGSGIIAVMFAADTPFVVGGFIRERGGVGWNWFWQSGMIAFALGTFLFSETWVRLGLFADSALPLLRFSGKQAKVLMGVQSCVEFLIRNNAVMGTVSLAMVILIGVGFDISGAYFIPDGFLTFLPRILPHGAAFPPEAFFTMLPKTFIFISITIPVIIFCVFCGFRGMILSDNFVTYLAIALFFGGMFHIFYKYGVEGTAKLGRDALASGEVRNSLKKIPKPALNKSKANIDSLLERKVLISSSHTPSVYIFNPEITGLSRSRILHEVADDIEDPFYVFWKAAFIPRAHRFKNKETLDLLKEHGLLGKDLFPPESIQTLKEYRQALDKYGIEKTEICAFLSGNRVTHPDAMSSMKVHLPFAAEKFFAFLAALSLLGLTPLLGAFVGGYIVQRWKDCKNENHAVGAGLFHCFVSFTVRYHPWTVLGVISLALAPMVYLYGYHLSGEAGVAIAGFLVFGNGLLGGAFLSVTYGAYLSTMTSQIFHGGAYVQEFWGMLRRSILWPTKKVGEKEAFWVSELGMAALICLLFYYIMNTTSLFQGWEIAIEVLCGAGIPTLLMFCWYRINCWSILSAVIGSLFTYYILHGFGPIDALVQWAWSVQPFFDGELRHGLKVYHYLCEHFLGDTWYMDEEPFRLFIGVLTVMPIWITATFLTAPEPPEVRRRFFARCLPWGYWPDEVKYFKYEAHHIYFPKKRFICAALTSGAGVCLIIGFTTLVFGESTFKGVSFILCAMVLVRAIFAVLKLITFKKTPVPKELYDKVFADFPHKDIFTDYDVEAGVLPARGK